MVEYWSPKPWVVGSSPSAPAKSRSFVLRLCFFHRKKWQARSGLSPKGSPTARKYSRRPRPRKSWSRLTPYFHRAHRQKQLPTVLCLAYLPPLPKAEVLYFGFVFFIEKSGRRGVDFHPRVHRRLENIVAALALASLGLG